MDLTGTLLRLADVYCSATGLSKARLATIVANDGKFFQRIGSGGGLTVRTHERCMRWLSDNWPDDVAWPEGIERPPVARPFPVAPTLTEATP